MPTQDTAEVKAQERDVRISRVLHKEAAAREVIEADVIEYRRLLLTEQQAALQLTQTAAVEARALLATAALEARELLATAVLDAAATAHSLIRTAAEGATCINYHPRGDETRGKSDV